MTTSKNGGDSGTKQDEIRQQFNIRPYLIQYWVSQIVLAIGTTTAIGLMANWFAAIISLFNMLIVNVFVYLTWRNIHGKQDAGWRQQIANLIREARNDRTPRNG